MNPKTVNTTIISGMLLCCEEKAHQMQDETSVNMLHVLCQNNLSPRANNTHFLVKQTT